MLIAQITDLHIVRDGELLSGRVDTRAALAACIKKLATLSPKPDVLLISGDLTETATEGEYAFLTNQLDKLDFPAYVVPGNHDDRATMRRAFPNMATGEEEDPFSYKIDNPDWPLLCIGLDSTVQRRSDGAICADRLAWLQDTLQHATPERPALIFMHHPPFKTGIAPMDACGILDGLAEFQQLIKDHSDRIAGILCGHVHRVIHSSIAGVPVLLAPSSAHQITLDLQNDAPLTFTLEPPKIALHQWEEGSSLVSHILYVDDFLGPYSF
ncbi:phosphodiesterase [Terasakiella pusilla]|uniref:phosphodiesterase n=1 Tax=Terasakiella pusilla TaxID=64973 RepID=UPI003AA91B4A